MDIIIQYQVIKYDCDDMESQQWLDYYQAIRQEEKFRLTYEKYRNIEKKEMMRLFGISTIAS